MGLNMSSLSYFFMASLSSQHIDRGPKTKVKLNFWKTYIEKISK